VRIVIFANGVIGDLRGEVSAWVRPTDWIVAADGGAQYVLEAGLVPHHVVGDVDSMTASTRDLLTRADAIFHISPPAKDETDLELALMWAAGQTPEQIVVLGAFGGRPDQALANLLLLALPTLEGRSVLFVTGSWEVTLVRAGEHLQLRGAVGDRVSLIPLGGSAYGVTTTGLAFPLDDETLSFGPARGVSNRFEVPAPVVSVREGMVWCFHELEDAHWR